MCISNRNGRTGSFERAVCQSGATGTEKSLRERGTLDALACVSLCDCTAVGSFSWPSGACVRPLACTDTCVSLTISSTGSEAALAGGPSLSAAILLMCGCGEEVSEHARRRSYEHRSSDRLDPSLAPRLRILHGVRTCESSTSLLLPRSSTSTTPQQQSRWV